MKGKIIKLTIGIWIMISLFYITDYNKNHDKHFKLKIEKQNLLIETEYINKFKIKKVNINNICFVEIINEILEVFVNGNENIKRMFNGINLP